jgi:hypothetical protein
VLAEPTAEKWRDAGSYWDGSHPAVSIRRFAHPGVKTVTLQGYALSGETGQFADA